MTDRPGEKPGDASAGRSGGGVHPPVCPACVEARHEIMMAVFRETEILAESVSAHIAACPSCREWEADLRRMHRACECAGKSADPAGLTEAVLSAPEAAREAKELDRVSPPRCRDRGVLAVSLFAVALANAGLAVALDGSARVLYPAVSFAAMLVATIWVYFDSPSRAARRGFWTALQPFTVPVGLIAYIVCREREMLRCPECGALSHPPDRYCRQCGKQLQEVCCRCGRTVRREFRVCPWCGAPLADCFPRDPGAGSSCGWSKAEIAFVIAANAALAAALAVALAGARGPAPAALYLLGTIPVFNWTALDARRRSMDAIGWGVLALVAGYLGYIVYLACRRALVTECPVCGSFPPSSFNYCPCCGSLIHPACPRCGAAGEGSYCASCGVPLAPRP